MMISSHYTFVHKTTHTVLNPTPTQNLVGEVKFAARDRQRQAVMELVPLKLRANRQIWVVGYNSAM